jgi:alpha-beta hydrolase superfamily lysophospholipase
VFICLLVIWYSGRYAEFAMHLNDQGYGVFGMDWIGNIFSPR